MEEPSVYKGVEPMFLPLAISGISDLDVLGAATRLDLKQNTEREMGGTGRAQGGLELAVASALTSGTCNFIWSVASHTYLCGRREILESNGCRL